MTTDVRHAVAEAERVLAAHRAPAQDGETDPRWQAIIAIGAFVESEPEAVWAFIARYGGTEDEDLRAAIACCLLEHLLEARFDEFIERCAERAVTDPRFERCMQACWSGLEEANGRHRIARLLDDIRGAETALIRPTTAVRWVLSPLLVAAIVGIPMLVARPTVGTITAVGLLDVVLLALLGWLVLPQRPSRVVLRSLAALPPALLLGLLYHCLRAVMSGVPGASIWDVVKAALGLLAVGGPCVRFMWCGRPLRAMSAGRRRLELRAAIARAGARRDDRPAP